MRQEHATPGSDPRARRRGRRLTALAIVCLAAWPALAPSARASGQASAAVPLWLHGPGAVGHPGGVPPWLGASSLPLAATAQPTGPSRPRTAGRNARALGPALLSGLVPGAGQVRNGSLLRGIGYFVVEAGSWLAYASFRAGARERLGEVARLAGSWDPTRYRQRASDPDSCLRYGCQPGRWSAEADSEIVRLGTNPDDMRYYEYLTRDAYECGWDSTLTRSIYRESWNDREAMLDARRWMGRVIFLNHLVSAIDAFIGARAHQVSLGHATHLKWDVQGLPPRVETTVRLTRHFGGPPSR